MRRIRIRQPVGGEQGWLNEVYLWEKFDIGLEYNVRTGVVQVLSIRYPVFSNFDHIEERDGSIHGKCNYIPLCLALQA